jgi:hypothetical protein
VRIALAFGCELCDAKGGGAERIWHGRSLSVNRFLRSHGLHCGFLGKSLTLFIKPDDAGAANDLMTVKIACFIEIGLCAWISLRPRLKRRRLHRAQGSMPFLSMSKF